MITIQYFDGKKIGIVSMHDKYGLLKADLQKSLKLIPFAVTSVNTDEFGTFSGEIERKQDALSTLRLKCDAGKNRFPEVDLFLASEGSFGPHPELFFSSANEELILLKDYRNDKEYIGRTVTTNTNYSRLRSNNKDEIEAFIKNIGFPHHGILLKIESSGATDLWHKNLTNWDELHSILHQYPTNSCFIEVRTDMRAHRNPTRQEAIKSCLKNLITQIESNCPACHSVYFTLDQIIPGLPCKACSFPTKSTLKYVYKCQFCKYEQEQLFPKNKKHEDPQFCDFCNP